MLVMHFGLSNLIVMGANNHAMTGLSIYTTIDFNNSCSNCNSILCSTIWKFSYFWIVQNFPINISFKINDHVFMQFLYYLNLKCAPIKF
jgi:hypothetical protein